MIWAEDPEDPWFLSHFRHESSRWVGLGHGTPKWAHTSNLPYVFLWFFSCFPWFLAEFPYEPWLNYGKFFVLGDGASANTRTLARARRARLVASPSSRPSICTAPASKWSLPSNRTSSVTGTARALGAWRIDHNPESYTHLSIHMFNPINVFCLACKQILGGMSPWWSITKQQFPPMLDNQKCVFTLGFALLGVPCLVVDEGAFKDLWMSRSSSQTTPLHYIWLISYLLHWNALDRFAFKHNPYIYT